MEIVQLTLVVEYHGTLDPCTVDEADQAAGLENYQHLLAIEEVDLVPNPEPFQCAICFDDIGVQEGIMLRECLHQFCRDCLKGAVQHCENATLTCPYQDSQYSCKAALQEREIRALVPEDMFFKYLQRSLDQAESQMQNSYHCKTPNCPGWCVYEDTAIHEGKNCQQYQDAIMFSTDPAARQTHDMLKNMVSSGEAMHCPQCQVIVQKKGGCDWIRCSICKTEICWVTKGRRWGPNGEGDISGGCRLRGWHNNTSIIQCYAPTNDNEEDIKDLFYEQLQAELSEIPRHDVITLIGDLNAKVGDEIIGAERTMGIHGCGSINNNGERLVELCASNDLVIGGTLFEHPAIHKLTWYSPSDKNQIDHIAINNTWRRSLLDVRVKRGADVGSDHLLVIASLRLKLRRTDRRDMHKKRLDVNKLKDPDVISETELGTMESVLPHCNVRSACIHHTQSH
ncbi:RanBP-type and C3HC4-type zinc finger-containing protein 1 [Elysia marginata]|uniref:RanBP-type and C3HC4-type zinc finger-containing protein 1 n=1 Tax=Elysia marginata TaxID=1093978 RepID=A0AAV4H8Y8_9GAST|nr:RanBP-type and C3HC4-type zinc finger-containing protein 1 [Elysia marginata]